MGPFSKMLGSVGPLSPMDWCTGTVHGMSQRSTDRINDSLPCTFSTSDCPLSPG